MDIARIDESATLGSSWIHKVSPYSKLIALGFLLFGVIVTWNVLVISGLAILVSAAVLSSGSSKKLAFGLAAYPAMFAMVFAIASAPNALFGTVIVLKAVTAALAAVLLILTTPYPLIFAPIQRVTPSLVGDSLLMTYRSTFLLLDKFSKLLTGIRLRSGIAIGKHPLRSAHATMQALGGLLLYSIDLSQRDYDVMRLRGYEGGLQITVPRSETPTSDLMLAFVSAVAAGVMISLVGG